MLLFAVGPHLIPNFLARTIHTHLWPTPFLTWPTCFSRLTRRLPNPARPRVSSSRRPE